MVTRLGCAGVGIALAICVAPAGTAALEPAPIGFGGPTAQHLPIALIVSADRSRIEELDYAVFSGCNFEGRADYGQVRDIPVAADGAFTTNVEVPVRSTGGTGSLGLTGRVAADGVSGTLRFEIPGHCDSFAVTWKASRGFVGLTSQGAPAVMQLSADHSRVSRFMLAWVPRCAGGTGLDPPENMIGIAERDLAQLSRTGRFGVHHSSRGYIFDGRAEVSSERVAGLIRGRNATGTYRAVGWTGNSGRGGRCGSKSVRFSLTG